MKSVPVTAEELGKAVKQFVSGTLASRKTMQGQAQDLGSNWLAANDLNFSERYLAAGDYAAVATHRCSSPIGIRANSGNVQIYA